MANAPEIGVILKALGTAKLVEDLKLVGTMGAEAGAEAAAGFDATAVAATAADAAVGVLEAELGVLEAMLPALGFVVAVAGLVKMVDSSLDAAEAIGKLAQKTGGSVETLSVLAMISGDVGVDMDTLGGALVKLSKNQQAATSGSEKQLLAFKKLGISIKDLNTLSAADLFVKLGANISQMADGPQRRPPC